ncbi:MAG: glycosyltransferase [Candidatus Aenigmatarchaeota archaeon]
MISVIIPAYNEEKNIERIEDELVPVLEKIQHYTNGYEMIVVDDGSTDKTADVAEKLSWKNKNIRLVMHEVNNGVGCAIRTGIENVTNGVGNLTVMIDADLTFHPSQIPLLLDAFKNNNVDFVIGSHLGAGGKMVGVPLRRRVMSKAVMILYSIVLGKRVHSVSGIFRLYKTEQLKELDLESRGFTICAEILYKLLKNKRTFMEVPVVLTTRAYGTSKLNTKKEIKNNLKFISKIIWWKICG